MQALRRKTIKVNDYRKNPTKPFYVITLLPQRTPTTQQPKSVQNLGEHKALCLNLNKDAYLVLKP